MKFFFILDCGLKIGAGHVTRNLGIAEELINRNYEVFFLGNFQNLEWLQKKINASRIQCLPLKILENLSTSSDILIIDSYTIDPKAPCLDRAKWKNVIVIFDEVTPRYDCDLMIHPGVKQYPMIESGYKVLSGPKYISFRNSIVSASRSFQTNNHTSICVLGGAVDTYGFVEHMSKVLSEIAGDFEVILFSNKNRLVSHDPRQKIFPVGNLFEKLICKFNLAFSTASSSSLELISKGCAVGIVKSASNQESNYSELSNLKVAEPLGTYIDGIWKIDIPKTTDLIALPQKRNQLIKTAENVFDLKGSSRIVDAMLQI
jgi:spore coat polysaccharide biosynthesis predicted glycosyltransferase SpsG